jgi:hypothetical protein
MAPSRASLGSSPVWFVNYIGRWFVGERLFILYGHTAKPFTHVVKVVAGP